MAPTLALLGSQRAERRRLRTLSRIEGLGKAGKVLLPGRR